MELPGEEHGLMNMARAGVCLSYHRPCGFLSVPQRGRKFGNGMSEWDPLPVSDGTLLVPSLFLDDLGSFEAPLQSI